MNIIREFAYFAVKHTEATMDGKKRLIDKFHRKIVALIKIIEAQKLYSEIEELSKNENQSIKFWCAFVLLKYKTDLALRILEELKHGKTIIRLDAEMIIDMWKKGMIK